MSLVEESKESTNKEDVVSPEPSDTSELIKQETLECPICLQACIHPVRLPCSHVFCFLCIKGVALQSNRCALCRCDIPSDYCDRPQLLDHEFPQVSFNDHCWYYEGRNGWWQYDRRTSDEIEKYFKCKQSNVELLIAGCLYIIDFTSMVQIRRNDQSRRRRIKRDVGNTLKKGIAGLFLSPVRVGPDGSDVSSQSNISSSIAYPLIANPSSATSSGTNSTVIPAVTHMHTSATISSTPGSRVADNIVAVNVQPRSVSTETRSGIASQSYQNDSLSSTNTLSPDRSMIVVNAESVSYEAASSSSNGIALSPLGRSRRIVQSDDQTLCAGVMTRLNVTSGSQENISSRSTEEPGNPNQPIEMAINGIQAINLINS